VKHQKKCSVQKAEPALAEAVDTSAQPATKAAPDPNNWVANVPWDQLNEDVLRAISQPGVPMYVGIKGGNYFKRLARMLLQLYSCREGGATPARRWIAMMAVPSIMLFAPPGVDLNADDRKQLQRKRLRLILSNGLSFWVA